MFAFNIIQPEVALDMTASSFLLLPTSPSPHSLIPSPLALNPLPYAPLADPDPKPVPRPAFTSNMSSRADRHAAKSVLALERLERARRSGDWDALPLIATKLAKYHPERGTHFPARVQRARL